MLSSLREINLLPPARRRLLRRQLVLTSLGAFCYSVLMGASVVAVAPLVVSGISAIAPLTITAPSAAELAQAVTQYRALRDTIAEQNAFLESLTTIQDHRIVWSTELERLLKLTPSQVTVEEITVTTKDEAGVISSAWITLRGHAINRNALTIFERQLRAQAGVVDVQSPTSNLLERTNPPYELTIVIVDTKQP